MRRWYLLLLPLALVAWNPATQQGGGVPAAAGGPTVIWTETFEPTPESATCDAGGADQAVTTAWGASTTCDDATGHEGSESGYYSDEDDSTYVGFYWPGAWSAVTTGTIYHKFLFELDSRHGTPTDRIDSIVKGRGGGSEKLFELFGNWNTLKMTIRAIDLTANTESGTFSVGTLYKICIKYEFSTDILTLYRDASGGTSCTTQVAQADGSSAAQTSDGIHFYTTYTAAADGATIIVDDISIETED